MIPEGRPRPAQNFDQFAPENNCVPRLIPDGSGDMFRVSEMIAERANFYRPQVAGMPPTSRAVLVVFQEPPRPQDKRFLGAQRVMFDPPNLAQQAGQFGFGVGDDERSLWQEGFWGHDLPKCNRGTRIRNQNLSVAGRGYTAFSLPNSG